MFKQAVTLVRGLMGCQSTDRSLLTVEQQSDNAKPLPVKSTQVSPQTARNPRQSVAQPSLKKPKAVSQTLAVKEGQSKKPKPVQTVKQPSTRGKSTQTPVRQTQSLASTQPKQKTEVAQSTLAVRRCGKGKQTAQAVATDSHRQPTGSKSKTVAPPIRQAAKSAPKRKV
jgi:hypothetical protein